MSLASGQLSVVGAATAALLASNPAGGPLDKVVTVHLISLSATSFYLGKAGVTNTTGYDLKTGIVRDFRLLPGDSLYVYAATTGTLGYVVNGQ